jgi:hypothetical protein
MLSGLQQTRRSAEWVVGQSWETIEREGQCDFNGVSAIAEGYGSSVRLVDHGARPSLEQVEPVIRQFMRNVKADTRYLD